jgi:signal transduction histidine kinase
VSGVVSLGTALVATYTVAGVLMVPFVWLFSRYEVRGSVWMAAIMLTAFLTAEAYVASLLAEGLTATLAWYYAFTIAISLSALSFLGFTLVWTGRGSLVRPRVLVPLAATYVAIPVAGLLALGLPGLELRSLIWAAPGLVEIGELTAFDRTPGPLGLLWRVAPTASVLVMLALLAEFTFRPEQRLYRKRNALLLAAPVVVTLISLAAQFTGVPVEVTPLAYLLTGGIFAVAIGTFGHFDVVPLATDSIVHEIDAGVLAYDSNGRVLDSNRRAREILGIEGATGSDVVGALATSPALADVPELSDSPPLAGDAGDEADLGLLEERLDGREFAAVRDGEQRQFAASISTLGGSSGTPVGRGILLFDVTERHRRERKLRRKNEQLERKNEQLERLADVVSHDMRGPLSTADTALALLRADLDDPDPAVERSLDDLAEVHDRLGEFVEHLPQLARGSTDVEAPVECDLADLAESAWRVLDTGAVELQVVGSTQLQGDPQRLQRVFENLFLNAVEQSSSEPSVADAPEDAVEHGTTDPDARTAEPAVANGGGESATGADRPDGVSRVRVGAFDGGVFVEDDGPGIPPARREDVFEFGTGTGDGSGFGLAIVRTVVEAHGWSIAVSESESGGARFEIFVDS